MNKQQVVEFLSQYGDVEVTTINNLYTEFKVAFALSNEQCDMTDMQLSRSYCDVKRNIMQQLGGANRFKNQRIACFMRVAATDCGDWWDGCLLFHYKLVD